MQGAIRHFGLIGTTALASVTAGCERYPVGTRNITSELRAGLAREGRYTLASSDGGRISCVCVFDWEDNPPHDRERELVADLRQACAGRSGESTNRIYNPFSMSHRHAAFVLFKEARGGGGVEYQIAERGGPLVAVTVLYAAGCFRGSTATIFRQEARSWEVKPQRTNPGRRHELDGPWTRGSTDRRRR